MSHPCDTLIFMKENIKIQCIAESEKHTEFPGDDSEAVIAEIWEVSPKADFFEVKNGIYAVTEFDEGLLFWFRETDQLVYQPVLPKGGFDLLTQLFLDIEPMIPEEIIELTEPFGDYAIMALQSVRLTPGFSDFLKQEFRSGKEHKYSYIIAVWYLSDVFHLPLKKRIQLNIDIMTRERTQILTEFLEVSVNKKFLRLLSRMPWHEINRQSLYNLRMISLENAFCSSLMRFDSLKNSLLRFINQKEYPVWLNSVEILRALAEVTDTITDPGRIFPPVVTQADEKHQPGILRSLKTVKNYEDLETRLMKLSQNICIAAGFPDPPFPGTGRLHPIRSGEELSREGRIMQHGVAGYAESVLRGRSYFYHYSAKDQNNDATIQLNAAGFCTWILYEYLGFKNKTLSDDTVSDIFLELVLWNKDQESGNNKQLLRNTAVLDEGQIAGLSYYDSGLIQDKIKNEDPLIMKREPENKYDSKAIALYWQENRSSGTDQNGIPVSAEKILYKIGYIPAAKNRMISQILDKNSEALRCRFTDGWNYQIF